LQFMLLERGHRLASHERAVVLHPARPAPWGISLRQQRNNLYNALLYKKHPTLYRSRLQAHPPWRYYATVAAILLAGTSAALHWWIGLWTGGAIWLYLTLQFCRRRLQATSRRPAHLAEMAVTSALIPPLAVFWRLYGAWRFRVGFL
jgi:hypothetical protein